MQRRKGAKVLFNNNLHHRYFTWAGGPAGRMGRTVAKPRPTGLDGGNGGNGGGGGGGLTTRHTEPRGRRGGFRERQDFASLQDGGGWCGMLNEC